MKIALIDADIIVFEACSVYGGDDPFDGTPRKDYTLEDLQNRVLYEVERILDATESEAPIMVFSPDSRLNFRKAVASTYKSNRGGKSTKPALYWELVRWCRDRFPSKSIDGLEGDDVLGIMQTKGDGDTVIVSTDKDMKTIPGRLYNHKKDEFLDVSLNEANWFWMYQTLCGDSTDGYGGCPGIGDKKATAALPPLDPNAALIQVQMQSIQADIQKKQAELELEREKMIREDDRRRDKDEADIALRAAEIAARFGAQVDTAAIRAGSERDREAIRQLTSVSNGQNGAPVS